VPIFAKNAVIDASASGPVRSSAAPETRAGSALYWIEASFSRATAWSTLVALEEETMTVAPSSMSALATAKPMPEVPPMTTTFLPTSLFTTRG
jgi:hypothetical protein